MEYIITPMAPSHLEQVEEIEKACFPDPWSRKIFEEALAEPNTTNLVALGADRTVLGYMSFTAILDEGDVNNIAVRLDCRGQGVASSLMEAFLRYGQEHGLSFLLLEVRPSNRSAVALYEKFGYIEVGRRKNYYLAPKEDAIIMRLELTNGTENPDPGRAENRL